MAAELTKDIAELESIRKAALRGNVQTFLDETIKQWRLNLDALKASQLPKAGETAAAGGASTVIRAPAGALRPLKKPCTYAFDESDKFVKLYYTIPGICSTPAERIAADFAESAFHIRCTDVDGVDYEIDVKGLANEIDVDKSTVKIKSDNNLLVMLRKRSEGQTWKSLLKLNKAKDTKASSNFDASGDPSDSMMGLMKKMYDDGDDDMKRTIRKAWHESQSKTGSGLPSLGDDL